MPGGIVAVRVKRTDRAQHVKRLFIEENLNDISRGAGDLGAHLYATYS